MVSMWAVSSFLVWAICAHPDAEAGVKRMPFLHALAIGACIKPTDPILAATVVKGRWAGSHVPARLAQLIWAESGANDGLGYPFLYFALYLIKYVGGSGQYLAKEGGAGKAMEMFFGETVSFVVLLSIAWGVAVGYAARKGLKFAESLKYVDKESFYSFALVLAVCSAAPSSVCGRSKKSGDSDKTCRYCSLVPAEWLEVTIFWHAL
jgi:NhaP-type Na+/H+ or K+/H+ antiporter